MSEPSPPAIPARPLPHLVDGFPRRANLDHQTFVEESIREARDTVDGIGADIRLTAAVVYLGSALDSVADYLEDVHPTSTPALDALAKLEEVRTDLAAAQRELESARGPTVGWLIERRDSGHPAWWAGGELWTTDPEVAVRFAREADGRRVVDAHLPGHHVAVTEHMWG